MEAAIPPGTKRVIDDRLRVYHDGYWIRAYDVPADTLEHKKQLIEALTRRLFNHVEHGINLPGHRLSEARKAFETETDPQRKRVKGAMLAGALFNRATDIFTKVVEMQALGVEIKLDNALLKECGDHLKEAFSLGKLVLHRSGEEGIDELWGEPLKAFTFPLEEFYRSRYIKIAQAMKSIDQICAALSDTLREREGFSGIDVMLTGFATAAKHKCDTLRTDPEIFDIWADFVAASEKLDCFDAELPPGASPEQVDAATEGILLVRAAKALIWSITRARVPMPKSTAALIHRCRAFHAGTRANAQANAQANAHDGAAVQENPAPERASQVGVRERLRTQTL